MAKRFRKSAEQHAQELGIGETTARRYLVAGMPEEEPKRSEFVARQRQAPPAASGDNDERELRKGLLAGKLKNVMLKNRQLEDRVRRLEGQSISRDDHDQELVAMATEVKSRLLAMPAKIAPRLALLATPAEVEQALNDEIDKILRVLGGDPDGDGADGAEPAA